MLKSILAREQENWILWLPVFFGTGAAYYFTLKSEPETWYAAAVFLLIASVMVVFRKRKNLLWPLVFTACLAAGFFAANLRTELVNTPFIKSKTRVTELTGKIEEIHVLPNGQRFILGDITMGNGAFTPKRIRLNINTEDNGAGIGDRVETLVVLSPPPGPVLPGGYDFARHAFFEQIGAVGYTVAEVKIIEKASGYSFKSAVEHLRHTIVENILLHMEKDEGNIATALLVGERGGIDKKILEDIRISGIAHILAISGMHLSMVAAIFFFFSRAGLALIQKFAINYNIKKWSAAIAIMGSLFYLFISGSPISAQRAFIMTTLILTAIIFDRSGRPMRSIAFAALIILIFIPESILTPSFQMSFAAVVALISCYDALHMFFKKISSYGRLRRLGIYILGLVISSLVAGAATTPFGLYHFNSFSAYGFITNLIAIPVTSFLVMPFGVVALLLMPFGLETLGLVPMGWGIDIIVNTATYIASLPQPEPFIPQMPDAALILFSLGGLWLCLWQTRWRLLAFLPAAIAVLLCITAPRPDIIINEKLFALKGNDGKLYFSSKKSERYAREVWSESFGQLGGELINDDVAACDSLGCIYEVNGRFTAIIKHPAALAEDCPRADIVINLTYVYEQSCAGKQAFISIYDLKKNGTYTANITENAVLLRNVREERGERPWAR